MILRRDWSFTFASPARDRTVSRHQQLTVLEAACKGGPHRSRLKFFPNKEIIMKPELIVGIDIAKAKFDVCLCLPQGQRHQTFTNEAAGYAQLLAWLQEHQATDLRVGIEATGPYWMSLAHELYGHGITVHLLNPAYVRNHARSCGSRSKTDRADSPSWKKGRRPVKQRGPVRPFGMVAQATRLFRSATSRPK